jgi:hypothetical protein
MPAESIESFLPTAAAFSIHLSCPDKEYFAKTSASVMLFVTLAKL